MILRGLFSEAECQSLRVESERLASWTDIIASSNLRTELRQESNTLEINKFDPVVDVSPPFLKVAADQRVLGPVESLFGEPAILFKDKIIFKRPGHGGFGPHQDNTWYRSFPEDLIATMVSIDAADRENGALEVAPGWHQMGNPVPEGEVRDLQAGELPPESAWQLIEMEPGDVVFFHNLLPHRSSPNRSDAPRRSLYLTYNRSSAGDLRATYYEYRRMLLLGENGPSVGNFYVPDRFRAEADYYPPVGRLDVEHATPDRHG